MSYACYFHWSNNTMKGGVKGIIESLRKPKRIKSQKELDLFQRSGVLMKPLHAWVPSSATRWKPSPKKSVASQRRWDMLGSRR